MKPLFTPLCCVVLGCFAPSASADVQVVKETPIPATIRKELWILSANWSELEPPTGAVNVPGRMDTLSPGDRIALALAADGSEREKLFDGCTLDVRIEIDGTLFEQHGLKPTNIRRLKAEGADFAIGAIKAAGLAPGDVVRMEQATALTSLAEFRPAWTAPEVAEATEVRIEARISGGTAVATVLEAARVKIRPWADWAKDPAVDRPTIAGYFNRYQDNVPAGYLLPLFKGASSVGVLQSVPLAEFFVVAFKRNVAAQKAALDLLPSLDPTFQYTLLAVLRRGGTDITKYIHLLPAGGQNSLRSMDRDPDPPAIPDFADPVSVASARELGATMDQCWGAWMASGDPVYLRTLVNLLARAQDYPAFQSWTATKGGAKGLNGRVLRGLSYQIAGWSIASFERTDPHAADWLAFWQSDPAVPESIRKEITSLPINPAFKRQ